MIDASKLDEKLLRALEADIRKSHGEDEYGRAMLRAIDLCRKGDSMTLSYMTWLKYYPVSIQEFIESPDYLNMKGQIYPKVLLELSELNNPDGDRLGGCYNEAIFTGSIGCAKTTCALLTTAYQLYVLSCFKDPHDVFGLDRSAEILFIFQSLSGAAAKNVDYGRFRSMMEHSPYFNSIFPFNKEIETELRFPMRVFVRPVGGDIGGTIGQNVFGGLIDEVNFMEIVENSKKSVDQGTYDQATVLYDSIARRRKSRFMKQGKLPGLLCLVSSKNYPGQFTDRKMEEAKNDPSIFVYDKRSWDIAPEGTFIGDWFHIFCGDETRQPFIIDDDKVEHIRALEPDLVMPIPVEYRVEFQNDIMGALRDIAGVSTLARYPFFHDAVSITECMDNEYHSIFSRDEVDFKYTQLGIYPRLIENADEPRWAHIDLSRTGDSTGIAIGYCKGFVEMDRGDGQIEMLPKIHIDGILRVNPPKGGEINFSKIRNIFYSLSEIGMNVRWISMDTWQSVDSVQIFRSKGYSSSLISMDRTTLPYSLTKQAIYDRRVEMPLHEMCRKELASLEIDRKKDKIDHPAAGCFCKDTMIDLGFGVYTSIEDLSRASNLPKVVSMSKEGVLELRPVLKAWETKKATEVLELEFDSGLIVRCTPEHPYMLKNGMYKEALYLTEEDELMY